MNYIVRSLVQALPSALIGRLGRLQFVHPRIGGLIKKVAKSVLKGEGTIMRGIGKGLKFDPTAGFPGMIVGTTELHEQEVLSKHLKLGGVFYDVGANIGFYATLAGRLVGPEGRVYAFEPHPETAERCRANARRNSFEHVRVVVAAVSGTEGSARLAMGQGSTENTITQSVESDEIGILVDLVTLDGWRRTSGAPVPSVVMIDAEGQEIEVLRGMRATIEAAKPVLMVEVHWLGEAFARFVETEPFLGGYRFTAYDGSPLRRDVGRYHALGIPT